jgi:hypothetical protein
MSYVSPVLYQHCSAHGACSSGVEELCVNKRLDMRTTKQAELESCQAVATVLTCGASERPAQTSSTTTVKGTPELLACIQKLDCGCLLLSMTSTRGASLEGFRARMVVWPHELALVCSLEDWIVDLSLVWLYSPVVSFHWVRQLGDSC